MSVNITQTASLVLQQNIPSCFTLKMLQNAVKNLITSSKTDPKKISINSAKYLVKVGEAGTLVLSQLQMPPQTILSLASS